MFICFDGLQMAGEVIDLPLGTALALSAVPDPDNETLEQQHIRIGSALAAEMQQQEYQREEIEEVPGRCV